MTRTSTSWIATSRTTARSSQCSTIPRPKEPPTRATPSLRTSQISAAPRRSPVTSAKASEARRCRSGSWSPAKNDGKSSMIVRSSACSLRPATSSWAPSKVRARGLPPQATSVWSTCSCPATASSNRRPSRASPSLSYRAPSRTIRRCTRSSTLPPATTRVMQRSRASGGTGASAEFAEYVGLSFEQSRLDVYSFKPSAQSWASGDRRFVCALQLVGGRLDNSQRGAALTEITRCPGTP